VGSVNGVREAADDSRGEREVEGAGGDERGGQDECEAAVSPRVRSSLASVELEGHLQTVSTAREVARTAAAAAAAAAAVVSSASVAASAEASERVAAAASATDFVEGGYLFCAAGADSVAGGAWCKLWQAKGGAGAELEQVDVSRGFGDLHDGEWKVLVLQSHSLHGTLHLMGTRRGSHKCRADLAEALVYQDVLGEHQVQQVRPLGLESGV
jgi:hypothetical protein